MGQPQKCLEASPHSFLGPAFATRLITQSYFGRSFIRIDPIFQSTPKEARKLLIKTFDIEATEEGFALGYKFDFICGGSKATPMEK